MLDIAGAVQRSFTFPAPRPAARAYFEDFRHVLSLLPHIRLVRAHGAGQFRVLYHTVELGIYEIRLYCDLQARFDPQRHSLIVTPLRGIPPVKPRVTLTSLTAQGEYRSTSVFHSAGDATQVDYHLRLNARLPKPLGLNLLADQTVERMAHRIVMGRIHEIADGFIERSLADYRKQHRRRP
ncbi:MAG: hypothetical protein KA764_07010 [Anaerolineales bacterium]|nr:hypothetical protein [Anaerolineales bacterium]